MAFTPKEPINISAVGGDGKQTGFTKIRNEFAWLYGTVLSGLFSTTTGHKHTGATNDAPQIGSSGIADGAITTAKLSTDIVSPVAEIAKGVPIGFIGIWTGSFASIATIDPKYGTWKLCDGTSGTIDLRDRFVVGAGLNYNTWATGGEATHTLTINEIPSHSHVQNAATVYNGNDGNHYQSFSQSGTNNTAATTLSTGGGAAHNNLPPYYALCYIQRVA